jgi:uncharacterized membrane protein YdjX (TVP38/TMEM64 family)
LNISLAEYVNLIRDFTVNQGGWGPVVYVLIYSFRSLVFFPASLLTILSGVLFGPWFGLIFTIIGENISANISFLVGRYFAADIGSYLKNKNSFVDQMLSCSRENGFTTVLFMRLGFVPFDVVGYCSGICQLKQKDFFLGTFLGTIPGLLTFTFLGSSILDKRFFLISLLTFLVSLFVAIQVKKIAPKCSQI